MWVTLSFAHRLTLTHQVGKAQRDGACSGLVVVRDGAGHEDVLVERQRGEPEGDDHPVPCGGGGE